MDSISRTGRVLVGLGSLLLTTMSGCHSLRQEKARAQPATALSNQTPTKPDSSRMAKTDFQAQVSKSQAFNTHLAMGKNAAREGNYPLAADEFQKALDVSDHAGHRQVGQVGRAEAHRQIAKAFDHLGKFPQSDEHYQKARKLAPNDPKVLNDWGYSYYLQGRYDLAEQKLRSALKLDPSSSGIYTNLGLDLAAAGKTDEALTILSKMGGPAVGHANLGYMLAALGHSDEARAHYRKALELQPSLAVVKTALARLDLPALPNTPPTSVVGTTPRQTADTSLRLTSATDAIPRPNPKRSVVSAVPTPPKN